MKVPFVHLHRQNSRNIKSFLAAVRNNIMTSDFILGKSLENFEDEFADYHKVPYAVGVASGTDALHLSLRAMGIGPGDEVIVPTLTFAATAMAVQHAGARPVPADVREDTGLLDVEAASAALTSRTRAVIPVHLYGQICDMDEILSFARRHHLRVIEDACQAHGARHKSLAAGTMGDVGCFSFYPSKNLGACGDGGMIVTRNKTLYSKLLKIRNYGQKIKNRHDGLGFNSRLDGLQASLLRLKLKQLDTGNALRRHHAQIYRAGLKGGPVSPMQESRPNEPSHVYHLFVVRSKHRGALQRHLQKHGVFSAIHYPIPIHRQNIFGANRPDPKKFPVAERLCKEILSLPMFPELKRHEIDYTIRQIQAFNIGGRR